MKVTKGDRTWLAKHPENTTDMQGTKLGYQTWAIAIYLVTTSLKGVSSMKLHRDLEITQKSAWHLAMRLRRAHEAGKPLFKGPVEADETYMGGKEGNKHAKKKLKAGRGPVGKTAVWPVSRTAKRARCEPRWLRTPTPRRCKDS